MLLADVSHVTTDKALRSTSVKALQHLPPIKKFVDDMEKLLITPRQQCPAREATCHNCSKKGHFKSVCRSRNAVDDISNEEEFIFLDTVSLEIAAVNGGTKPWTIGIHLNGDPIEFKIDTGADVTVIPQLLTGSQETTNYNQLEKFYVDQVHIH